MQKLVGMLGKRICCQYQNLSILYIKILFRVAPIVVRTGGIDLNNNTGLNFDIPIAKITSHPKYNQNEAYNDIAIIELERETQ